MTVNGIYCQIGIVDGSISISGPATLNCSLDLEGYDEVDHLPDGLTIYGNLNLIGTNIRALPSNLTVFGNVDLEGCDTLQTIGRNVYISGNLDVEVCRQLRSLPPDLVVKGAIFS
ncbi:hypothetical protein [Mesorhizobium sp. M0019]|uniref:hypothetical protein n=1 Tax=unclassified Mesorhizobium TaxID=325217 RepID=UPI00333B967F